VTEMRDLPGNLEFGVGSLADIRVLLQAWHGLLARKALAASGCSLVLVMVEDRLPGEEIKLCFQATRSLLRQFLQSLEERGCKFTCHELIPGMLTLCRMERNQGEVRVIHAMDAGDPGA
jgi:hypothetical protein